MKNFLPFFLLLFLFNGLLSAQVPEFIPVQELKVLEDKSLLVDDFSGDEVGTLPRLWLNQRGDNYPPEYDEELRATYRYQVLEENGNHFLRFDGLEGKHLNFPVKEASNYTIHDYPKLTWKWRAHQLPEGADESSRRYNDTTASIYVVFSISRLRIPRVIRYTWSSTHPVGTEISRNMGYQQIYVVESGTEKTGEWIRFERNIKEDYKRLHGGNPPSRPLAILILSDGRSTGNHVKADYDDIRFLPASY